MQFLRRVWEDIRQGENLDLYVTVLVSWVLVLLNVVGMAPQSLLLPLNLGVLGLLAIATLGNRYRLEALIQSVTRGGEDWFYQSFPTDLQEEIDSKIEQATNLLIMGTSLDSTLYRHYRMFEQKLSKGDTIRIVLVNPNSFACAMLVMREYRPIDLESRRTRILSTLQTLRELQSETSGKLEVRVIDYPLTHGGFFVDLDTLNGAMYVWNYNFKTHAQNRPKFVLCPGHGYWYDLYKEEADAIWENAEDWTEIMAA